MRKHFIVPILGLTLLVSAVAMAADGQQLYSKCSSCHGADGSKQPMGVSKPLKGMSSDTVTKALVGYKEHTYGGEKKGVMERIVTSLSDEDIAALAAYITKL